MEFFQSLRIMLASWYSRGLLTTRQASEIAQKINEAQADWMK